MKRYHLFPSELQVLQLFSFKIFHCFFSGGMKGCLGPQQHLYWFHSKHTTKQRIKGHYVRLHSADLFLQLMLGYILTTNSQILQLTFYLPCINWIQYLLLLTSWCRWEGPKLWIYVDDMIPWFIGFHFLHWRRFISPLSTKEKKRRKPNQTIKCLLTSIFQKYKLENSPRNVAVVAVEGRWLSASSNKTVKVFRSLVMQIPA